MLFLRMLPGNQADRLIIETKMLFRQCLLNTRQPLRFVRFLGFVMAAVNMYAVAALFFRGVAGAISGVQCVRQSLIGVRDRKQPNAHTDGESLSLPLKTEILH